MKNNWKLSEENANIRIDMASLKAELKEDIVEVRTELSKKISNSYTSLINWMFIFWLGQIGTLLVLSCSPSFKGKERKSEVWERDKKYTAGILTKIAEYLLSIVILGSIISGHFYPELVFVSGASFLFLVVFAIILVASTED
ncbi:hypothetical protein COZ71_00880 [Candidatus Desantisbacteria bacterium CG_4_8_14_3_um_filter_40_12]|uniref:Uncharacterized protein n=1 Tax=Candidatus Desantisbacteria bacterium CG_4_8_14_3_um_filter_40_12 TaxID=1974545 RepID=A0A2M7JET4_9BACT|nr:MAG: hypothetical protein COZ71_00880 [Candidatus Desantisbacteria bacterium CG_4_8_14_3_um_filter_40_12]